MVLFSITVLYNASCHSACFAAIIHMIPHAQSIS